MNGNRIAFGVSIAALLIGVALAPFSASAKKDCGCDEKMTYYRMVGAGSGTVSLNAEPSEDSEVLTEIPGDARCLEGSGKTQRSAGTWWVQIEYQGQTGWVKSRFLAEDDKDRCQKN